MSKIFTPEECEALEKQCREAVELLGRANNLLIQRTQDNKMLSDLVAAQDDCIVKLREKLKQLREEQRWIPAEERLPDQELEAEPKDADGKPLLGGYECIAQIEGAKRPTALWYCHIDGEGVWTDESGENFYRVTHWKPMPKGPEAE